jgi:transposase
MFTVSGTVEWIAPDRSYHGAPRFGGIKSIAKAVNRSEHRDRRTIDTRCCISSAAPDMERIAEGVRGHWGVESLHWILDVEFKDDLSRCRTGHGAAGKVPVFGLLKRNGRVYVAIIPNVASATLFPIIRDKIRPDSIVYTDSFKSYDALDVSEFRHVRINHSELFADQTNHINGIENFWNQAKRHLRSFNGIPSQHFHLFIKECEWRFNNRPVANLAKLLSNWWLK